MKIAVYSRKSKFTGKGESIENQVILCREYIKLHIAKESEIFVYEDEGFSAKDLDRPKFKEMMKTEEKSPFDYIVVYRLDRISRNVGDFAKLIEKLNEMKTAFVCIKEQFDTSTPMGRAMMNISAVFAQLERETIAERIRDNIILLAKTGRWLGGVSPLGFKGEKTEIKDAENKRRFAYKLSPVRSEIKTVKTIFEKYLELNSFTKTVGWLMAHGIKTREGNDFRARTVKDILKNPVYCAADKNAFEYFSGLGCEICFTKDEADGKHGIMPFYRTTQSGKKSRRTLPKEWIIALGKHKGVISSEEWIKTQDIIGQNASKTFYRPSRNETAIFTGLVKCGKCGHNMRPRINSGNKTRKFSYMCEYKERSHKSKCDNSNINGNLLDEVVFKEISKCIKPDASVIKYLNELLDKAEKETPSMKINELKKQILSRKRTVSKLMKAFADSENETFSDYAKREVESLDKEIKNFENEISEIEALEKKRESKPFLENNSENLTDLLSVAEKRYYLNKIIEKIVWDGENVHVYFKRIEN